MIARLIDWWAKQNDHGVGSVEYTRSDDAWDVTLSEIDSNADNGEVEHIYHGNCWDTWIDDDTPPDIEADMANAFWHAVKAARGEAFVEVERARFESR